MLRSHLKDELNEFRDNWNKANPQHTQKNGKVMRQTFKKWLEETGQAKAYDDLLKQDAEFGKQLRPNKRKKKDKEAVPDI